MPGSPRTLLRQLLGILACALASLVSAAQDGTQNALQIELVSRDARLIDVTVAAGHVGTIELSLSNESVSLRLGPGEPPVRLRLDPGGTIRASAAGEGRFDTGWFDPFAELVGDPAAEETPEWALGAVWYNVFPERFENGNPLNDQGWPYGTDIPWDQPWFESSADEFEASANRAIASPRRYADSFSRGRPPLREGVFERRFGGDLQGVERRLGHIRDLGATVIWFCPIFESTSLHKYDAGDYRHIDPHLAHPRSPSGDRSLFSDDPDDWEWTPADRYFVDRFLPAAREKGLRIVLDGVWNHVGLTHPTFVDALKRGPASPYFGWYDITADRSGRPASWRAWDRRNGALPEFHQANGDLHPGVRSHVFDVTKRWMDPDGDGDPADGIDGWRLDVANEIGMRFWADWRSLVRSINPGSVLVGELWFDGADYFEGRAFDSQMNYPLAFALTSWLGGQPAFSDADLVAAFDRVLSHAPATDMAQVNLLGSHDTARFITMLDYPSPDY
ncbi:MAG: alpha-amylase family glycosyl hydrolase, partial [Pseudomonadota bacterium]